MCPWIHKCICAHSTLDVAVGRVHNLSGFVRRYTNVSLGRFTAYCHNQTYYGMSYFGIPPLTTNHAELTFCLSVTKIFGFIAD